MHGKCGFLANRVFDLDPALMQAHRVLYEVTANSRASHICGFARAEKSSNS